MQSKKEQLESLVHGKGLQYLADECYRILGNPVLIHDMEYRIIAITKGITTDDPIWNEYASEGGVDIGTIEFFMNEQFLDTAANTDMFAVLHSSRLRYDRFFGKLYNGDHIQIGAMCMPECCKPFDDDDRLLFKTFCSILCDEVKDSVFYRDYGQAYMDKLLRILTAGGITDRKLYSAHVESIYSSLKENIYLAVFDTPDGCENAPPDLIFRIFQKLQPSYKYYLYENRIVALVSTDGDPDAHEFFEPLLDAMRENGLFAGVSGCFENLFELNKYYREASQALEQAISLKSECRFRCAEKD